MAVHEFVQCNEDFAQLNVLRSPLCVCAQGVLGYGTPVDISTSNARL